MTTLADFLRARLDEDEQTALAATEARGIESAEGMWGTKYLIMRPTHPGATRKPSAELNAELADHIARHDPARALREIEAKRAIIDVHRWEARRSTGSGGGTIVDCQMCNHFPAQYPCATMRALAAVYATHPDYKEEWAP